MRWLYRSLLVASCTVLASPLAVVTHAQDEFVYTTPAGGATVDLFSRLGQLYNAQQDEAIWQFEPASGGWNGLVERMTVGAMAGLVDDAVRMAEIHRPAFVEQGLIMDMTSYAAQDPLDMEDYFPNIFDAWTVDGKLYGIPTGIMNFGMFINKDLFDDRGLAYPGLDWETTWTWDEFLEATRKLSQGEADARTFGTATQFNIRYLIQFIWQNGGSLLNDDRTRCTLTDPEAVEALEFVRSMVHEYRSWPSPQEGSGWNLFLDGRVGTYMNGSWAMLNMSRGDAGFNWGVVPLPRGRVISSGTFIDGWVVPSGAQDPEESWRFLKFLAGETAANYLVDEAALGMPFHLGVAQQRLDDLFNPLSMEEKMVWFNAPNYASYIPWTVRWDQMYSEMGPFWGQWAAGEISTESLVTQTCSIVNSLL